MEEKKWFFLYQNFGASILFIFSIFAVKNQILLVQWKYKHCSDRKWGGWIPTWVTFFFIFWSLFYITKLINFYCICINIGTIFRKFFKLKTYWLHNYWRCWLIDVEDFSNFKTRYIFFTKIFFYIKNSKSSSSPTLPQRPAPK